MAETPTAPPAPASAPEDRTLAAVAYILTWITGLIVFFLAKKDDRYARWHAIQAIGLGIVAYAVGWILGFVMMMSAFSAGGFDNGGRMMFPFGTGMMGFGFAGLWWLLVIILVVVLAVKAYRGEKVRLPIIADFADRNA